MEISRRHLMPAEAATRMEHHRRIGAMTRTELQQAFPNDDIETLLAMQVDINSKLKAIDAMQEGPVFIEKRSVPPLDVDSSGQRLSRNQRRVRSKPMKKPTKRK